MTAHAQKLCVWQTDGQTVYYDLTEKPKTTFDGADLVIETHLMTIRYPLSKVQRFSYDLTTNGISTVNAERNISFSQNGEDLTFVGIEKGKRINIYSIDGILLSVVQANADNYAVVSLGKYPVGVYIFKVDGVTYKFMKR